MCKFVQTVAWRFYWHQKNLRPYFTISKAHSTRLALHTTDLEERVGTCRVQMKRSLNKVTKISIAHLLD